MHTRHRASSLQVVSLGGSKAARERALNSAVASDGFATAEPLMKLDAGDATGAAPGEKNPLRRAMGND